MKILVVEDEPGIHRFLKDGLEEEGYEVEVAEDGLTGLHLAQRGAYDLILLDWMLPHMPGIDVCQALRAEGNDIPIIFLTAKDTVHDAVQGLRLGADDYIRKPFSFEELLERIAVQMKRRAHTAHGTLALADMKLDPVARQVFRGEAEVHLTQREFDLLAFLLAHKGQVCSRKDIIAEVWDIHFEYDTGVIDVFVNSLRRKLGWDCDEGPLHTLRGIGYALRDA